MVCHWLHTKGFNKSAANQNNKRQLHRATDQYMGLTKNNILFHFDIRSLGDGDGNWEGWTLI